MVSDSAIPERFIENPNVKQNTNNNQRSKSNINKSKSKKDPSKPKSQIKQFIDLDKQKYKLKINDLNRDENGHQTDVTESIQIDANLRYRNSNDHKKI